MDRAQASSRRLRGVAERLTWSRGSPSLLSGYFKTLFGPFGDPAFEMTLYTVPNRSAKILPGEWSTVSEDYHWHIEVIPNSHLRSRVGGIYVNELFPEEAASKFRQAWK